MVAFLRRLPLIDADAYRALALRDMDVRPRSGRQVVMAQGSVEVASACVRCHGAEATGTASRFVPILHGQPMEYLAAALEAYATGLRPSGIMQPIATGLTEDALRLVALYYANLDRPPTRRSITDGAYQQSGRTIATEGVPAREIPPCLSCHGPDALPAFPSLAGQNQAYLANQLQLWNKGVNLRSPGAQIMAPIARRLDDQQIEDVSAYFAHIVDPLEASRAQ